MKINSIILLKEAVVDEYYDPVKKLFQKFKRIKKERIIICKFNPTYL